MENGALVDNMFMCVIFACKYGFINIHATNIITSNITTHLRTQSPSIVDYCLDYRTVSFLEFSILKLITVLFCVFYKHMKIQLHLIHLSNINHFAYFRAKANSLELVLLGVVGPTMNPTQIHYS